MVYEQHVRIKDEAKVTRASGLARGQEVEAPPVAGGQGAKGVPKCIKNGLWVSKILASPLFALGAKFLRYTTVTSRRAAWDDIIAER